LLFLGQIYFFANHIFFANLFVKHCFHRMTVSFNWVFLFLFDLSLFFFPLFIWLRIKLFILITIYISQLPVFHRVKFRAGYFCMKDERHMQRLYSFPIMIPFWYLNIDHGITNFLKSYDFFNHWGQKSVFVTSMKHDLQFDACFLIWASWPYFSWKK